MVPLLMRASWICLPWTGHYSCSEWLVKSNLYDEFADKMWCAKRTGTQEASAQVQIYVFLSNELNLLQMRYEIHQEFGAPKEVSFYLKAPRRPLLRVSVKICEHFTFLNYWYYWWLVKPFTMAQPRSLWHSWQVGGRFLMDIGTTGQYAQWFIAFFFGQLIAPTFDHSHI